MEQTIARSEALKQIDTGQPFDMEFVTADRKRGTGGDLVRVVNWCKKVGQPVREGIPGNRQASAIRNPNHRTNKTINIYNPHNTDMHPTTVHIRLIQFFNGKRVINA